MEVEIKTQKIFQNPEFIQSYHREICKADAELISNIEYQTVKFKKSPDLAFQKNEIESNLTLLEEMVGLLKQQQNNLDKISRTFSSRYGESSFKRCFSPIGQVKKINAKYLQELRKKKQELRRRIWSMKEYQSLGTYDAREFVENKKLFWALYNERIGLFSQLQRFYFEYFTDTAGVMIIDPVLDYSACLQQADKKKLAKQQQCRCSQLHTFLRLLRQVIIESDVYDPREKSLSSPRWHVFVSSSLKESLAILRYLKENPCLKVDGKFVSSSQLQAQDLFCTFSRFDEILDRFSPIVQRYAA